MAHSPPGSLMSPLADVPDPRHAPGKRHPLVAMLAHACCAILRGCRGHAAISQWGRDRPIDLMHELGYRRTPASLDAFQALFSRLDAPALEAALARWAGHLLGPRATDAPSAASLDGKSLRGSLSPHSAAIHLLAALDQQAGCVLGRMRVDGKANEHKAAPELLKGMALGGRVITGDAMSCQRDPSRQVIGAGGHYLWKVDDNQPTLEEAIRSAFEPAGSPPRATPPGA